jgi:hypothetical protein
MAQHRLPGIGARRLNEERVNNGQRSHISCLPRPHFDAESHALCVAMELIVARSSFKLAFRAMSAMQNVSNWHISEVLTAASDGRLRFKNGI